MIATSGYKAIPTPPSVATPLPPENPLVTGNMWPSIAVTPASKPKNLPSMK